MKLLYIGAGLDIKAATQFPECASFVFIDTQPRSENDYEGFYDDFYRGQFYNQLLLLCKGHGFELIDTIQMDPKYHCTILCQAQMKKYLPNKLPPFINPTLLILRNPRTEQQVNYYISTNVTFNMCDTLKSDIETSNGLIISGYIPKLSMLQYFTKQDTLFGYNRTMYIAEYEEDDDCSDLIDLLKAKPNTFAHYYSISHNSGLRLKCKDIYDVSEFSKIFKL